MTKTKKELVNKIYKGKDPFLGFEYTQEDIDMKGIFDWNADHPLLPQTIKELDAKIVVEAGVFRGGSIIKIAEALKETGDGCIIAIDTFYGDEMLFEHADVQSILRRQFGIPQLWRVFYANIIEAGLKDYVLPLAMSSFSGFRLLSGKHRGTIKVVADMVHIDASHVAPMPYIDCQEAWDVVRPGGAIVIDDWVPNQQTIEHDGANFLGIWHGVTQFCNEKGVKIEHPLDVPKPFKCRFFKNV